MAVITISRGTFAGGRELATKLAEKLGYNCISREELSDEATKMGVPVGKLQMSMVKPPRVYRRLARERDQYLACMTMMLCERIMQGNCVYQGHTGHMLLPGVPNILRIRVLANTDYRVRAVAERLGFDRKKARQYITEVDIDRDKWVRFLYGVDWLDPFQYDLVINLDQTGISNAATALCAVAELPDFKLAPASKRAISNLHLASKAHLALMTDPRTSFAEVKVTANEGVVQVTYLPQQSEVAPHVQEVLSGVSEIREVHTTIAQSSILYIQERFDYDSQGFADVVRAAKKWDAAVELMTMSAGAEQSEAVPQVTDQSQPEEATAFNGGIEDDAKPVAKIDQSIGRCLDELMKRGCSGGSSVFYDGPNALAANLQRRTSYSMVVLGDLFLNKPSSTRVRLRSEMKNVFADHLTVPVVEDSELQEQLGFGVKQVLKLVLAALIASVVFAAIFTHQQQLIGFLSGEEYRQLRILAVLFVAVVTPLFAYSYGTFTRQLLKLFGLD